MKRRSHSRTAAALITAALVVSACTSDDDSGDDEVETSDVADDDTEGEGDDAEGDDTDTTEGDDAEGDDMDDDAEGDDDMDDTEGDDDMDDAEGDDMAMDDSMVGVEGGSGCGIPHGAYESAEASGEVRVAWNDPLLSFNQNTTHANATANANVAYLMHSGFTYYDGDLNLINNDQFGTCTIESLEPLTITYRINEGVAFSDGTPITAHDLILGWGAVSGNFNEGGVAFLEDGSAIQTDEEGNWLVLTPEGDIVPEEAGVHYDPETFELFEGFEYVAAESVNFDAASEQFELVTQFPEVSEDGQAITMVYDSFYVDYQNGNPFLGNPAAHVVGRLALGIEDPTEAKQAVVDAFQNNDSEALAQIATVFNTAFDWDSLPDDEGIYLSTGMYTLEAYEERAEMTLVANPDYTWGPQPKVETIIYRIIGDPTAAVQALANEEIDVMQPQATVDSVAELEGYADRGVELVTGDTAVYEHVDFAVANGGPFDPAAYGGDEATALAVRQALMKTLPRAEIVERLIAPINPEAEVRDSFTQTPGAPWYDGIVAGNGTADYAEVDIEGAIALLEEAGVETPVDVRVHFADNNPRRASEYELMAASAAEAGFNLIDGRSPTWGSELSNPSIYDMAFFGWQSTAVAVADTEANFVTGGANNFYAYSNEEVDALYDELKVTTDPARQEEILTAVEAQLVETGFGLPLFQFPGVTAYNTNYVSNIDPIAISPTIFWNVWDWEAA